ncbi:MAG TPA: DUF4399 domain-containing protein [Thermoanaerobaculia bacterium]|nr:DUF4399 domain-containing protein [Thermoanaerobaculia bacterium]
MSRLRTIPAHVPAFLLTGALLFSWSCAPKEEAPTPDAASPEAAATDHGTHDAGAPRVYFVGLEDGATVPLTVQLQFAAENFTIEPVADGAIHHGAGHYHIGLDTDCLPAGVVIPTADPWIHFGDGSSTIEVTLTPGEHRLALQIGDGEHRTLADPGLCQVIRVVAVE